MHFRDELQRLEMLLHFPEEVAHRLTDIEHELFYNIEPVHYIRQGWFLAKNKLDIFLLLFNNCSHRSHLFIYLFITYFYIVTVELNPPNDPRSNDSARMNKSLTVKELIERFNEVGSLIYSFINYLH